MSYTNPGKKCSKLLKIDKSRSLTIYNNSPDTETRLFQTSSERNGVINLSSKPLSDGEQSILQKGPKFAVSSSKVPIIEYIAVTKRICDELGENTTGEGLHRNLPKNQGSPTTLQGKEGADPQHHQTGEGGHQNPQGRLLSSSTHSRQRCSFGGHGQKPVH